MNHDMLKTAVVRIHKQVGGIVGAGFLVNGNFILTCAHVLDSALSRPFNSQTKPSDFFLVDFPLIAPDVPLTVVVPDWGWRPRQPDNSGDIAVLSFVYPTQLPSTASPLSLISADDLLDREFETYGFPRSREIGVSASGHIKRGTTAGWYHIEDKEYGGYRIQPGFSGAPIWDRVLKSAVGLINMGDEGQQQAKSGFMIPGKIVLMTFPQLPQHLPFSWIEIKTACTTVSNVNLRYTREHFDNNLYVARNELQQYVTDFLASKNKYLAFVGPSGMGKSTFLDHLENQLQANDTIACLFFDAARDLKARDVSVHEAIFQNTAQTLGLDIDNLLKRIHAVSYTQCKLVLIIDAINEFDSMEQVNKILKEFRYLHLYPWLKIIISCRPQAWDYIKSNLGRASISENDFYHPPHSDEIHVPFGSMSQEEAPLFYEKFSQQYGLRPSSWTELREDIQKRLREPLLLSLIAKICHDEDVNTRTNLLVDIEIIPKYVETLFMEGKLSVKGNDDKLLSSRLPSLFIRDDYCFNSVPRKMIVDQFGVQTNDSIERLIYAGVLKEDMQENLSFSFERFYGYYVGIHLRNLLSQGRQTHCGQEA